jgi:protein SCO1/2
MVSPSRCAPVRGASLLLAIAISACGGTKESGVAQASSAQQAPSESGSGFKSGVFEPPRAAPDFELQGSHGSPLSLAQFRGKVVIVQFGFTLCPSVCPVTLKNVTEALRLLGPRSSDVQLVFVTVDPQRDTPERLREYLDFFDPRYRGVTGTEEQLEAVNQLYGVEATRAVSENEKLGYEMHHTSSIYLVDRAGLLRVLVPYGKAPKDIAHDLDLLLET